MKVFLKYLGYILILSAFPRILPIAVGLFYGESIGLFVITFLGSLVLGIILLFISRSIGSEEVRRTLTFTDGLKLVAVTFVIVSVIGAFSFLPTLDYNFLDAWFEAVSGYTTTGLSMYSSLEGLSKSLLIWRAETQWVGGLGIVMVFLFIFSRARRQSLREAAVGRDPSIILYKAQGFSQKIESGIETATERILSIYLFFTFIGVGLLFLSGLPLLNSLGLAFTSLSTGGFSITDSFQINSLQLAILCSLMVVGSISFITHTKLFQKRLREFVSDLQIKVFLTLLASATLITFFVYGNLQTVIFEVISSFSTTGFSLTNIPTLPPLFIMVILLGMIIGGGMTSTAGGVKVFRFYTMLKSIKWLFKKLAAPPHAITTFKIEDRPIKETDRLIVHGFFFTYISILFGATIVFLLLDYSFLNSFFQVTSALGTVGLSTINIGGIHEIGKFTLIICMLLGRLEIFPLLIVLWNGMERITG